MPTVTATSAGRSVSTDYTFPSAGPALPTITEAQWSTLAPVGGENFNTTLARLGSNARVVMPAGVFNIIDNKLVNNYAVYNAKVLGLRGAGVDKTILQLVPNTFSVKTARPTQPATGIIRFGPNGSASGLQRSMSDLTILGAPQVGTDGLPMFFGGYFNYFGRGEFWNNVKIVGLNYGGGNSPNTGESFGVNMYRDVNSTFYNVEVDGRDVNGNMVTASPMGFNGSQNSYLENCYFHHSLYSGLTYSIAGTTATPTNIVTTMNVKVEQNANHNIPGAGTRFTGVNHEHVTGKIVHTNLDVTLDRATLWDTGQISIYSTIGDNADILIDNPEWHGQGPAWADGAFVITLSGKQVTPPVVKNADGSLKTPVIVKATSNPPDQHIDPLTQYACRVDSSYVAP